MEDKDVVIIDNMPAGEIELRKTFEEVTKRNVNSTVAFTQETRKMFRELEQKILILEKKISIMDEMIQGLNVRLAILQENSREIE